MFSAFFTSIGQVFLLNFFLQNQKYGAKQIYNKIIFWFLFHKVCEIEDFMYAFRLSYLSFMFLFHLFH